MNVYNLLSEAFACVMYRYLNNIFISEILPINACAQVSQSFSFQIWIIGVIYLKIVEERKLC